MPKQRAPPPPPTGDTPPDSPPPPPPGQLHHQRSHSSITSQSSVSTQGSGMGHNTADNRQDYRKLSYYYSNFTNQDEVCQYLSHHSKKTPGFFLLRPSFSNRNSCSVSTVVSDKTIRHTNIKVDGGRGSPKWYYLVPEVKFPSVQELIAYYGDNDVKNLQKVTNVRFLYPLKKRRSEHRSVSSVDGSESSGTHYQSANDVSGAGSVDRPALPERPRDLPRLPSQNSIGLHSPSNSSLASSLGSPDGMHNGISGGSTASGGRDRLVHYPSSSSIDARPPARLPMGHNTKDGNPYYSSPRNVDEDITDRLKEVLRQNEICDCGIPRDKADLPLGWTVHRSKDPTTYGRIFFQNNKGVTSWKLPQEVQSRLNIVQQENLSQLKVEANRGPINRRQIISDTKF